MTFQLLSFKYVSLLVPEICAFSDSGVKVSKSLTLILHDR